MSHPLDVAALTKELDELEMAVTGVLASHPNSTDVHISSLSLTFHGQELLSDTSLELNSGRRYGLIGLNGTGIDVKWHWGWYSHCFLSFIEICT